MKRSALLPLLTALCGGCLRSALQADAPASPADPDSMRVETWTGATVEQVELLDPRALPMRPLVVGAEERRRLRPVVSPSPPPPAVIPVAVPPEPQLAAKEPVRHTDEDASPPPRKPFLRPAVEDPRPQAAAAVGQAEVAATPVRAEAAPSAREKPVVGKVDTPRAEPEREVVAPVARQVAVVVPPPAPPQPRPVVVAPAVPPPAALEPDNEEQVTAAEEEATGEEAPAARSGETPLGPEARYQVQIMSASDPENAEDMRMQALLVFPDEHVEVVWDAPNYKVRVGGAPTIEEANELKRRALRLGFQNAWVVPRRVP
jgi:hypothetical protein